MLNSIKLHLTYLNKQLTYHSTKSNYQVREFKILFNKLLTAIFQFQSFLEKKNSLGKEFQDKSKISRASSF